MWAEGVSSSKGKGAEDGKTAAEDDEEDSSGLDDLLVCLGQVRVSYTSIARCFPFI